MLPKGFAAIYSTFAPCGLQDGPSCTPTCARCCTHDAVLLAALVGLDFSPRADWPAIEARDGRMRHAAKQLESRIPAEATLASVRGFHLHMLLDRPVYSLRWAGRRAAGVAGIESVIERYGIDTVILEPSQELDRSFEPYFVERSGAGLLVDGFRVIPLTSATGSR